MIPLSRLLSTPMLYKGVLCCDLNSRSGVLVRFVKALGGCIFCLEMNSHRVKVERGVADDLCNTVVEYQQS